MWKEKTNMHNPPAKGNFCDEHGNAIKPSNIQDNNRCICYVDKGARMANNCSISCRTWRWTKKLFFQLLDIAGFYYPYVAPKCQTGNSGYVSYGTF